MSRRMAALGMGVLAACFLFLAQHDVGRAQDDGPAQSGTQTEASNPVLKVLKPGALPEKETNPSPEARIRVALDSRVRVHFVNTPLNAVCKIVGEQLKIPVVLDRQALDDMGIEPDTPMICSMKDVRLGAMLDFHLDQIELTWIIENEVLFVTTEERADCLLETRVYDVSDLLGWPGPFNDDWDSLTDLLACHIQPTTWGDVGGPTCIPFFDTDEIQALLVPQSRSAHEEIAALFADLRAYLPKEASDDGKAEAQPCRVQIPAGERKVRKHLEKKIDVDYADTPLEEAIKDLEEQLGLEIEMDLRSLEDMGISPDTPVTLHVSGISAGAVLNLLLPEDLTYTFREDFLVILTEEQEEATLFTRVYEVSDLVGTDDPDFDSLTEPISGSIGDCDWAEHGGPGTITPYENAGSTVLVISHTWRVHRQVEAILDKLRAIRHKLPPSIKRYQQWMKQNHVFPGDPYGSFGSPLGGGGGRFQPPAEQPEGNPRATSGGGMF